MRLNKIPLEERLDMLNRGYASDPEYDVCCIRSWAKMPIGDYMAAFYSEKEKLLRILAITEEQAMKITYQETAFIIDQMLKVPEKRESAWKAVQMLALPFLHFYKESRKEKER